MTAALVFIPQVKINQNTSDYLTDESEAKQGLIIIEEEFKHISLNNSAKVLIKNHAIEDILKLKMQIQNVNGVQQVIWLDNFFDLTITPIEFIPDGLKANYYLDNKALLDITFIEDANSTNSKNAINEINELLDNIGGVGLEPRNVLEIGNIAVIVAIIILLLIIILFTDSFIQALLMCFSLGLAIVLNLGSNIVFGSISKITLMASTVIQLAVSIDYSLVFFKNLKKVRENNSDINSSIIETTKISFKTILASSLTTIAGFLALGVMNYKIGTELGFVLAKGVFLSLITIVILLPVLVKLFIKSIDKTKHKSLLPSIGFMSKFIHGKVSYIILIFLLVLTFVGYYGQLNNEYLYSENHIEYNNIERDIVNSFGEYNQFVLIVPKEEKEKELGLVGEIYNIDEIKSISSIYLLPEDTPDEQKKMFLGDNYSLIFLNMDLEKESDITFSSIKRIRDMADKYFDESYLIGESAVIYDVKEIVETDYLFVIIISMVAIALIIFITFKSIFIPILLLLTIQTAIWINMSIPYYQGTKISFLGYILISSIQLGATIDYAIIITENYEKERKANLPLDAAKKAFKSSNQAILVSMLALIIAGISLTLMMDMDLIKELGILISRGTFISGVISLLFLPQLLIIFDRLIGKTTLKRDVKK